MRRLTTFAMVLALLLAVAGCGSTVKPRVENTTPVPAVERPADPIHEGESYKEEAARVESVAPKPKPAVAPREGESVPEQTARVDKATEESDKYTEALLELKYRHEEIRKSREERERTRSDERLCKKNLTENEELEAIHRGERCENPAR